MSGRSVGFVQSVLCCAKFVNQSEQTRVFVLCDVCFFYLLFASVDDIVSPMQAT